MISNTKQFFIELIFNLKINYIKKRKKAYKIIPLGTYCLPRVIATLNKLKPTKEQGELSCPFDLAFFNDINKNNELIKTKFEKFFDNIEYNEEKQCFINKELNIIFNHDKNTSPETFTENYKNRINNFYNYLSDDKSYKYFLLSSFGYVTNKQIDELFEILKTYIPSNNFSIILINQSNVKRKKYTNSQNEKNFYLIDEYKNHHNFKTIQNGKNWREELKSRKSPEARKIYNSITKQLINILSINDK